MAPLRSGNACANAIDCGETIPRAVMKEVVEGPHGPSAQREKAS
jgi:hypothetical protein